MIAIFLLTRIVYHRYTNTKTLNIDYTNLMFSLYVNYYLDFPSSEESFKQFYIETVFSMGQKVEFLKNNPIIENSVQFTTYKDQDSIQRIRGTLSRKPRQQSQLLQKAVSLEDFSFYDFITNSSSILLFDIEAYRCGGTRRIVIFEGNIPNRCIDERVREISKIIKQYYQGFDESKELAIGSPKSCYLIEANRIDSAFRFRVDCYPQDSSWIDQDALDLLLNNLAFSFNTPEVQFVRRFYFPIIAKNTTLQQPAHTTHDSME